MCSGCRRLELMPRLIYFPLTFCNVQCMENPGQSTDSMMFMSTSAETINPFNFSYASLNCSAVFKE